MKTELGCIYCFFFFLEISYLSNVGGRGSNQLLKIEDFVGWSANERRSCINYCLTSILTKKACALHCHTAHTKQRMIKVWL